MDVKISKNHKFLIFCQIAKKVILDPDYDTLYEVWFKSDQN